MVMAAEEHEQVEEEYCELRDFKDFNNFRLPLAE